MMRGVIYARYSCEKQNEQSIDGQIRVCNEFANNNDITIINTYIDKALSGKTDKRPNFMQLIEDSKNNNFDYVIVYKLDRFSRNRYDSAIYKNLLKKNNVKVLSACEQISDNPEGIILEALIEGMAEYYSAELAQKTKRGMRETIIKGNFTGGKVLFGYKVINKKVQIEDKNANAMRYTFKEYAKGKTFKQIAIDLNNKGYTYNGKPFKASNLQDKLNNKRYIGINEYEGEIYTNTYPPIIDQETFDKVQIMLKRNKHNSGANKAKIDYILSGKLFCGYCGNSMVGTSGKSQSNKYTYYTCSKRYKKHECTKDYEQKEWLENFVIDKTLQFILKPKIIDEVIDNAYTYFKEHHYNSKIQKLEKELQKINEEIDNRYTIFTKTNSNEILKRANADIERLEIDKSNIEKELNLAKMSTKIFKTKEELRTIFDMFINGEKTDKNFRKRIVKLFINSIFVFEEFIVIYYNLFDDNYITFEEMQEHLKNNFNINGVEKYNKNDILKNMGSQKAR